MKITIRRQAGPHTTWNPHTFDSAIDARIPISCAGVHIGYAYLRRVTFTENRRTAMLLIEIL